MTTSNRLHLDLETYSECDIKTAGAHEYAAHPSTEILMCAYALGDGPVYLWTPAEGEPMPGQLAAWLADDSVHKWAFNAAFERLLLSHVKGVTPTLRTWRCTMVAAYYLGFSGGLGQVASQMGLAQQKDTEGQRLIRKFSCPTPKNQKLRRRDWNTDPEDWAKFKAYCIQDVETERAVYHFTQRFPTMLDWDWERYALDQIINDRGAYTDRAMATGAMSLWEREKESLEDQLAELTGLPRITRGPFAEWLRSQGVTADSLAKDKLDALAESSDDDRVKRAISLWQEKEGKAVAKYDAVLESTTVDGRARGLFQFKGASRTDRTSGRRIQLQNLKRSFEAKDEGIAVLVKAISAASPYGLRLVSGQSVSEALGGCVRHVIQAAPGKVLVQCDLSSIESVVLGWLTYCYTILNTFRNGRDTYKEFATRYYGVEYTDVTKAQRTFSKPPVLGCGYMLGANGLVAYAEGYGVAMSEKDAKRAVDTFRGMYPEIPNFWRWIDDAVKYTTRTGLPLEGYRLRVERDAEMLRIWLPSGRALSYYKPDVVTKPAPWADMLDDGSWSAYVDNFSYMGTDRLTTQWTRTFAHAGLLTENIVQSVAMDILFDGIQRAEAAGLPVVSQVHDELVCEVPEEAAAWAAPKLKECMTTLPTWAPDLWLGGDGYISKYYKKD